MVTGFRIPDNGPKSYHMKAIKFVVYPEFNLLYQYFPELLFPYLCTLFNIYDKCK